MVVGLLLRDGTPESLPSLTAVHEPGVALAAALHDVLGDGRLHAVSLATVFLAWVVVPSGLARRFAIGVPLATTLVLLNPWLDSWIRANVVGPYYWRTLWALPLPVLLALVACAPTALRLPRPVTIACSAALVVLFCLLVPSIYGFSEANRAQLDWPRPKVAPGYRFAQVLNELSPGQRVVAPARVSAWVPVSHDPAHPLAVRFYLALQRRHMGEIAFRDRMVMTRFVEGSHEHPRAAAIFERGLELYDVHAVCLQASEVAGVARSILRRQGFTKHLQATDMEIWVRTGAERRAEAG